MNFTRVCLRLAGAAVLFSSTGCGLNSPQSAVPRQTALAPLSSNVIPEPFGPQSPQSLREGVQVTSDAPPPPNLNRLRHGIRPLSSVGTGDHEDAGIGFQGAGRYTSLAAVHTIYPALNLGYPSGQSGNEYLFAPTTKAGCLENVTVYVSDGIKTQVQFSVFDWCNSINYILTKTVDSAFVRKYVRRLSNGETVYSTEIFADASKPESGTVWRSLIYNHITGHWDTMASLVQQKPPDYNGWSIFETYYLPGPCLATPAIAASHISLYDTVTRTWRLLTPELVDLSTSVSTGPPGACFIAGDTGPATYRFDLLATDYSWSVNS